MTQGKSDPFPENKEKKRKKEIDPDLEGLTNVDRRVSDKEFAAIKDNQVLCGELKGMFEDFIIQHDSIDDIVKEQIKDKFKIRLRKELKANNLI